MVAECFVLEVRVAVGECISETSVVCEQCEESVLTVVSVSRCLPVKGKVERCIEVTSEVDCPLLNVARGDVVLQVGPGFLCGCAVLGIRREVSCNYCCPAACCWCHM